MKYAALCALTACLALAGCEKDTISVIVPYENELYVVSADWDWFWSGTLTGSKTLNDGRSFTIVEPGKIGVVTTEKGVVERFGRLELCLGRDMGYVRVVVWNGEDGRTQREKYCRGFKKV